MSGQCSSRSASPPSQVDSAAPARRMIRRRCAHDRGDDDESQRVPEGRPGGFCAPRGERAAFAADPAAATVPLYKVLYDTRFAASVAFARRAAARGLVVHAMAGDMTRFWYDDLYHRWQTGTCRDRRAHGPRRSVLSRAARVGPDACAWYFAVSTRSRRTTASRIVSTDPRLAADERCRCGVREWPGRPALADVVAECPRERGVHGTASALTVGAGTLPASETLFSWVIAPVPRA